MKRMISIITLIAALLALIPFLYALLRDSNSDGENLAYAKSNTIPSDMPVTSEKEFSSKPYIEASPPSIKAGMTTNKEDSLTEVSSDDSDDSSGIDSTGSDGETEAQNELPEGFVYLNIPEIIIELRYATENNFTGTVVDGYYSAQSCIVTVQAAHALEEIQKELSKKDLSLIIYDSYRPCRAVEYFSQWSKSDDNSTKEGYYPNVDKGSLFSKGYLAHKSAHSRGSTIDVSLIDLKSDTELDMGGHFDLLDPISSHTAKGLTTAQIENRKLLREAMEAGGFVAYSKEWWHYTLKDEPFPNEYFDFDVR